MPLAIEPQAALDLSARLCCLWLVLQSTELIAVWTELRDKHLLGCQDSAQPEGFLARAWNRAQRFPFNLAVVGWRAAAAAACLVVSPGAGAGGWLLLCSIFACQLYANCCFPTIFSNADNIVLICLGAIAVGSLPEGSDTLRVWAIGFIAFQALLAYFASGIDKLSKAHWRDGSWLTKVFCDSSHRFLPVGLWLRSHPRSTFWLAQGVIWLELLFPLCLVLPPAGFWTFMIGGFLFHAGVMVFMALPGFFWAFAATYPALYFAHAWIAQRIHS